MKVKSRNKCFPQKLDLDSRNQSSQAGPAPEEEVPSLGFPKAVLEVSGKGLSLVTWKDCPRQLEAIPQVSNMLKSPSEWSCRAHVL